MPEPPDEEHAVLLDGDSQSSFDRPRTDSYGSTIFNLVTPDLPLYDEPLKVKAALYASHFLSAWGIRMWEFAIGLILLELYPSSLALVSAFGLVDGAAQIFSGPLIGDYVDRGQRFKVACSMYMLQNGAVAVSALTALISYHSQQGSVMFGIATTCTIIIGSASSVGAQGSTLSVEKEWTTALCERDSQALAQYNSGMRAIDLSCLLLSPIAAGFLMTYGGMQTAILVIALWNLIAWLPECYLLYIAQQASALLRQNKTYHAKPKQSSSDSALSSLWQGWKTYFRQGVWPAAVALALLYLTVLSLGLLMTAYLKWQGMSEAELSLWRGAGAVSGLLSTVAFPLLHKRLGLKLTGLAGVWWQAVALLVAVFPVWLTQLGARIPQSSTSHVLLVGLIASRFGLWLFDLAVSQMLQEWIPEDELGVVNGVQSSLQNLLQSLSYVTGLLFWRPTEFPSLMFASAAVVVCASCMYTVFHRLR